MMRVTRASLYDGTRIASAIAGMSLLAACSGTPWSSAEFLNPTAAVVAPNPAQPRPAVEAAPARQAVRAAPGSPTEAGFASTLNKVEAGPAAPFKTPINDNPGRLLGLDQPALRSLLGKPGFVRRDDPARMWRYRHASCVLDLFLYSTPSESVSSFRVRHIEVRSGGLRRASTRTCLRALLADRSKQPAG